MQNERLKTSNPQCQGVWKNWFTDLAQTWPKDSLKSTDQHGNNHFETFFMFYDKIFQFSEEGFLAPLVNLLVKLNIE